MDLLPKMKSICKKIELIILSSIVIVLILRHINLKLIYPLKQINPLNELFYKFDVFVGALKLVFMNTTSDTITLNWSQCQMYLYLCNEFISLFISVQKSFNVFTIQLRTCTLCRMER